MEKFFTPVELHQGVKGSSGGNGGVYVEGEHAGTGYPQSRPRPHRSHRQHSHHLHPHCQEQEPLWSEDQGGHGGPCSGQDVLRHHHGHRSQDHHHHQDHRSQDSHRQHGHRPSSPSSSSSWSSEASVENEAFPVDGRCKHHRTQHSQSCTDISKGRGAFEEEDDEGNTRPLLSDDCQLYRSASLERSLASKDVLKIPESRKPKKAVSYIQLPTKGILKNKQGQEGEAGNFRKAKSMEVLSSQKEKPGTSKGGAGGAISEKELEQRKAEARQNFLKEKLQFSAFLNEISRQVLSPARLSSLGVTDVGSSSPKLPREERRGPGCRQEEEKQTQQGDRPSSPESVASSALSHCSGYSCQHQHQRRHHRGDTGGGPPLRGLSSGGSTSPESSPPQGQGRGPRGGQEHRGGSHNLQTDGTNTSPELSPCRHHSQHTRSHEHRQHSYSAHQPEQPHRSPSHRDISSGTPVTPDHESDSSRLDSPRSIASPEPRQTGHVVKADVMSEAHRLQVLQKQNEDLHHSLLQTAMRMECMEVAFKTSHQQLEEDLQRTQRELESLKDKFKRLQEKYSSSQRTNQQLQQEIQSVSASGEVDCLDEGLLELTERLTERLADRLASAQTARSLEIIPVPSLFEESPGKDFEAEETANRFLLPVAPPPTQFMDDDRYDKIIGTGDGQALGPVLDEKESDWLLAGEEIQRAAGGGQRSVTAFLPWKQEQGSDHKGDEEAGSESGREEGVSRHPPRSLQIPHLQFTMHPETLPIPSADLSLARFRSAPDCPAGQGYGVESTHQPGSPIRVLSASFEGVCPAGAKRRQAGPAAPNRADGAATSLRRPEKGTLGESDEADSPCGRRQKRSGGGKGGGGGEGGGGGGGRVGVGLGGGRGGGRVGVGVGGGGGGASGVAESFEPGASCLIKYRASPGTVSHLLCQLRPVGVKTQGWTGEVAEEVLNVERTQL